MAALRYAHEPTVQALTLTPAVVVRTPGAFLALSGSVARFDGEGWSPQGSAVVARFSPLSRGGFVREVSGALGLSAPQGGAASGLGRAGARLHWLRGSTVMWLGGEGGATWDEFGRGALAAAEVGALLATETTLLTLRATPTWARRGGADASLRYTDLSAAWTAAVRAVDLSLSLGARTGVSPALVAGDAPLWGGVSAALWMSPRVALAVAAGIYPSDPSRGFPEGRHLSVSLRLGGWRSVRLADAATARSLERMARAEGVEAVVVRSLGPGRIEVRARAPGATQLEWMGDASLWRVRTARREDSLWWTFVIEGQGATELVVRVNGGPWLVLPGSEVVTDEFGGRVGRLRIP